MSLPIFVAMFVTGALLNFLSLFLHAYNAAFNCVDLRGDGLWAC